MTTVVLGLAGGFLWREQARHREGKAEAPQTVAARMASFGYYRADATFGSYAASVLGTELYEYCAAPPECDPQADAEHPPVELLGGNVVYQLHVFPPRDHPFRKAGRKPWTSCLRSSGSIAVGTADDRWAAGAAGAAATIQEDILKQISLTVSFGPSLTADGWWCPNPIPGGGG